MRSMSNVLIETSLVIMWICGVVGCLIILWKGHHSVGCRKRSPLLLAPNVVSVALTVPAVTIWRAFDSLFGFILLGVGVFLLIAMVIITNRHSKHRRKHWYKRKQLFLPEKSEKGS